MYPSNQDYKLALMIGADSFRTLENIEILSHPLYPTEPWFATGGLAIVFKIKYQGKLFALKCFTKESAERQERLLAISDYLKQNPNPYFVDFTYLENELWVENENGGEGYPVVLMEWVEGLTLDNYLKKVCANEDKPTLKRLYDNFGRLILWIQAQPIAHGDLKHDNILVMFDGQLKLIDYDGMYIPAFRGLKATELGSPCYQHPLRTAEYFNENLDDFSLLILQITLLAFETEPYLFFEHFNGDGLLFKDYNFKNFKNSNLKTKLWGIGNAILPLLSTLLVKNLIKKDKINFSPYLIFLENQSEDLPNVPKWLNYLLVEEKTTITDFLSEFYQFKNTELLEKNIEKWDWNGLSRNQNLPWSIDFIEKYEYKWDWGVLSRNKDLPWSIEFIEKYKSEWYWDKLSYNENLPWSIEFIEKYKEKWDWGELSHNKNLPWSIEFIEKYEEKWDWNGLSRHLNFPWSIEFIEKHQSKWDWDGLSCNENLPWSIEFIEKFKEKWFWGVLGFRKNLPWSIEFIEKFKEKWFWSALSYNKNLPWSIEFIEKYKEKWFWGGLSCNTNLPWSIEFIGKYDENWDWNFLSQNINLPWSIEFIEKYKSKWYWDKLSYNENLPWSIEFIENYKEKWDWSRLSRHLNFDWSTEFIEKYESKWDWDRLSINENLPHTDFFLDKYYIKLKWDFVLTTFLKDYIDINSLSGYVLSKFTDVNIEKYMNDWDVEPSIF
ncbi:MAG: serine/threonine-protein kinase [Leadbetterella sp.]|nr:serine/threonine-protein kinase [Leadbetterella sp.]